MLCVIDTPAPFAARQRVKCRARTTPPLWCRRCGWQLTRRASGVCVDCAPPAHGPRTCGHSGLHLRRLIIARLIAERGPLPAAKVARVLRLTDRTDIYHVISGSPLFAGTPDGYVLTEAGREVVRRYEGRAEQ